MRLFLFFISTFFVSVSFIAMEEQSDNNKLLDFILMDYYKKESYDAIESLLKDSMKKGITVDELNESALQMAICANNIPAVKLLLKYGASVNFDPAIYHNPHDAKLYRPPLYWAVQRSHFHIVAILLNQPTIDVRAMVKIEGCKPESVLQKAKEYVPCNPGTGIYEIKFQKEIQKNWPYAPHSSAILFCRR